MSATRSITNAAAPREDEDEAAILQSLALALRGLRYGSVEVVVHDGRVVQIIRTEKLRVER